MGRWDGWDGWDGGHGAGTGMAEGSGGFGPGTAPLSTALARSRDALVFGPGPALPRPAGWPGTRPGDALRGLAPAVRQQLVLGDLLRGLRLQFEALSVSVSHGRTLHTVSAGGLDLGAELAAVEAKAELRPERLPEILAQQPLNPVFWATVLPLSPQRTPWTLALMAAGASFASHVVQRVKAVLHVPRPADLSPRIQPMLPTPGSASFPGAHATEAALVSGLLYLLVNRTASGPSSWGPSLKPMLDELAARIAENREVAGLNFPSDSSAGKALGDKLLAAMLEAKSQTVDPQRPQDGHTLAWLWQQAATEWGGA